MFKKSGIIFALIKCFLFSGLKKIRRFEAVELVNI